MEGLHLHITVPVLVPIMGLDRVQKRILLYNYLYQNSLRFLILRGVEGGVGGCRRV